MNISQEEYETKYNEYLTRVRERRKRELLEDYTFEYLEEVLNPVTLYSIKHNFSETKLYQMKHEENGSMRRRKRSPLSNNDAVYVRFPIEFDSAEMPDDVEEAVLRLLLSAKDVPPQQQQRHSYPHQHQRFHRNLSHDGRLTLNGAVTVKVYQLIEPYGRVWLASRTIEFDNINEPISSRWIELDVSKAVNGWLLSKQSNLGLEIVCDNCHQYNMYIMEDYSANSEPDFSPVLNIVGRFGMHREKRSRQHHHFMQASRRKPRKTDCVQENNKCCRHKMEVVFSEIKGYDFIIQPKTFDAGYCRGRCPPRYNPAHQHAFFQSLIWKQDKTKVPRPCCAPSKLAELEVLHVDEKNKNKLQVSTWKDMRVQECACS
ncbi:unnamed protein product [Hermetia illucens]|uniref:TGF-beta family profile domain-containing protein n=2 Tax=Hermetia illucens TaxID=343691 RepID=A0A7R8V854_HERIL|nr:unnamed protein product [Hermetia illucens]